MPEEAERLLVCKLTGCCFGSTPQPSPCRCPQTIWPHLLYRGDIAIKLFPEQCPKTIENFTTHAKNGYYDNVIFHRCSRLFAALLQLCCRSPVWQRASQAAMPVILTIAHAAL